MKKSNIVVIHICLWIAYILVYATVWGVAGMSFADSLVREILLLPFKIALVYICILILVPYYLQNKKYIGFISATLLLIVVVAFLHNAYFVFVVPETISRISPGENFLDWERITKRMTYLTSPMLFALTLTMIRSWYEQREQNALIIQENLKARLHLLKQQLQPHFFFNTLNSLYSLSLQKSDQTPEMILKLSSLMRYVSDQQSTDWVTLKEEIDFVENCVAIEKIRYHDRVNVTVSVHIISPQHVRIPPLALSTFVENAFKHGIANSLQPGFVKIELKEDKENLYYTVQNSKTKSSRENNGTGLSNLRDRLRIMYGKNFSLITTDHEHEYIAHLQLKKEIENV